MKEDLTKLSCIRMQKLLYWFHGDFLACAAMALDLGFAYVMKQSPATHLTYVDLFSSGLSGFVAFRKTGKESTSVSGNEFAKNERIYQEGKSKLSPRGYDFGCGVLFCPRTS